MIEKADVMNMARAVFARSRGQRTRQLMHPNREWGIGLVLTLVTIIVGSIWVYVEYSYYRSLDSDPAPLSIADVEYRRGAVQLALTRFQAREEEYQQLLATNNRLQSAPEINRATDATTTVATESVPEVGEEELPNTQATSSPASTVDVPEPQVVPEDVPVETENQSEAEPDVEVDNELSAEPPSSVQIDLESF